MKGFELKRWLITSAKEDRWWFSIDGVVYDDTYDLSEISEIALDFPNQDLRVQHVSAANADRKSEWLKYEPDINPRATNRKMVQNATQANSVVSKNTERKKESLRKSHVCVVLTSWAILIGWVLKKEHTLNLSELQVEGLEKKIKLQEGEISSFDSELDDLKTAQEASYEAIGLRDGFLKKQSAQLNNLNSSYLALVNANKKLQNLNSELVADSEKRSKMISSLQNEVLLNTRQSEALVALEREKIRLIKQQNAIKQETIERNKRQQTTDSMESELLKQYYPMLVGERAFDQAMRNRQGGSSQSSIYINPSANLQYDLDQLNRRLDDVEFQRRQREHNEAVRRNEEEAQRRWEQQKRDYENLPSTLDR